MLAVEECHLRTEKEEVLMDETSNQSADAGGRRVPFAYRKEEVLMDETSNQSADGRIVPLACEKKYNDSVIDTVSRTELGL